MNRQKVVGEVKFGIKKGWRVTLSTYNSIIKRGVPLWHTLYLSNRMLQNENNDEPFFYYYYNHYKDYLSL